MKNIFIVVLLLVFSACSKGGGGGGPTGGGAGPAEDPIVADIVRQAGAGAPVEAGDTQSVVYDDYYELDADNDCDYQVSEIATVTSVQGDDIAIDYKRNSSALPGNPAGCAAELPNMIRDEASTTSRIAFRDWTANHVRMRISPPRIIERTPGLASAVIQSAEELTYLGSRAKKIVLELVNNDGRRLRQTVYVSLDSEFLGVLEYSRRALDTGRQISFYRTIAYRVAGGRLVYP